MRTINKKRAIALTAVCAGIAGGCWWLTTQRSDSGPPPGSIKLIANWKQFNNGRAYVESGMAPYFWTTGGDLLYCDDNPGASKNVVRYHLTPHNSMERYNTVRIPQGAWLIEPTPDGSGMLYWTMNAGHPHDGDLHMLSSDGRVDRLLPAIWMLDRVWLPDGKHWLISRDDGDFLNGTDGIALRKLDTRSVSKWYPFVLGVNQQSHAIATILASGDFMAPGTYRGSVGVNYPEALLLEFDPNSPSSTLRQWRVRVPDQAVSGSIVLSPAADRILWIVEERVHRTDQMLNRILPSSMRTIQGDQAVYVSRLNGSGMRKLFSAHRLRRSSGRNGSSVTNLMSAIRWLPDDRRISFIYDNALYIAPVN